MKTLIWAIIFILGTSICFAQETKQPESKNKQLAGFEWLTQFEGNWATEYNGSMTSRSVGKKWIVNEISFQKGVTSSVQTIGYDAKTKKFIGTWIDTSSSFLWQYSGSLDSSGKILILAADGPDLNEPTKIRQFRDTYEFKSENEIAVVSQMLNDKGQWKIFNKSKMTRKVK